MLTRHFAIALIVLGLILPALAPGRTVKVPLGTVVYGEIDQRVTSRIKKDGTDVGDMVLAHVWRDVTVGRDVVITAGTPMMVRVSDVRKAKMAGIRGRLELESFSTTTVDGEDVPLEGGYDKSGHGRKALSITLAAVVAWPLIFIQGKDAILEPGTVFDARIEMPLEVEIAEDGPPTIDLRSIGSSSFDVEILYDEMDPSGGDKRLPLRLRRCDGVLAATANVTTVNGTPIPALPVTMSERTDAEGCTTARGTVDLKQLGKHLTKGINRFEVTAADSSAEVVLDIEL